MPEAVLAGQARVPGRVQGRRAEIRPVPGKRPVGNSPAHGSEAVLVRGSSGVSGGHEEAESSCRVRGAQRAGEARIRFFRQVVVAALRG